MAKDTKKAAKKKDAPTPRAGKKRATTKFRKQRRKSEITSAPRKDASGQDLSDSTLLKPPALALRRGRRLARSLYRRPAPVTFTEPPRAAVALQGHTQVVRPHPHTELRVEVFADLFR